MTARHSDVWPGHYKFGMWVWVLHRITGIFIIFSGFCHMIEIMLSHFGPDVYNVLFGLGYSWWLQAHHVLLIAALLYHSMNGLRVILFDLGIGVRRHKLVFIVVMLVALVGFVLFAVEALPYIIGRPVL